MFSTTARSIRLKRLEINKVFNHLLVQVKVPVLTLGHLGTISDELFRVTSLALLCEDVVNGMIAANEYGATAQGQVPSMPSDGMFPSSHPQSQPPQREPLDIIVDIEHRDWDFRVQAGTITFSNAVRSY
jgi:hypothetical protein